MAYQLGSGSGEEKTFEDIIKGFDSDRHRVMLVAVLPVKTTLVVVSGVFPTSLCLLYLISFTPSHSLFLSSPLFFKISSTELRICSNYSIFSC